MFACFQNHLSLLDDEDHRLEYLKIKDEQHLVIEGIKEDNGDLLAYTFKPSKNLPKYENVGRETYPTLHLLPCMENVIHSPESAD